MDVAMYVHMHVHAEDIGLIKVWWSVFRRLCDTGVARVGHLLS